MYDTIPLDIRNLIILSNLDLKCYLDILTENVTIFLMFFVIAGALTIAVRQLGIIDNKIFASVFIYILCAGFFMIVGMVLWQFYLIGIVFTMIIFLLMLAIMIWTLLGP
jgi:hypothetical protein